jgi:hypothetical protein
MADGSGWMCEIVPGMAVVNVLAFANHGRPQGFGVHHWWQLTALAAIKRVLKDLMPDARENDLQKQLLQMQPYAGDDSRDAGVYLRRGDILAPFNRLAEQRIVDSISLALSDYYQAAMAELQGRVLPAMEALKADGIPADGLWLRDTHYPMGWGCYFLGLPVHDCGAGAEFITAINFGRLVKLAPRKPVVEPSETDDEVIRPR